MARRRALNSERGVWLYPGYPPRITLEGRSFTRAGTLKWNRPGVAAQYREDVATNSAHLFVYPNRTWRIDHYDDFNPAFSRLNHLICDVIGAMREE